MYPICVVTTQCINSASFQYYVGERNDDEWFSIISSTDNNRKLFQEITWLDWLTYSWWKLLSYRSQSIGFLCKTMDWFLYDRASVMKELNNSHGRHVVVTKILFLFASNFPEEYLGDLQSRPWKNETFKDFSIGSVYHK